MAVDGGDVDIDVDVDASGVLPQMAALMRSVSSMGEKVGNRLGDSMTKSFEKQSKQFAGKFSGGMSLLVAAAPLLTSGLSAVAGAATALTGSLTRAAISSLSAVGVMGALTQGAIVTGIAFQNMGKAITGDAEALEKLAPSARLAATAIGGFKDEAQELQRSVQGAVFRGLSDDITRLGNQLLPMLKTQLTGTGTVLNGILADIMQWASAEGTVRRLGAAFKGNNAILETLGTAATPILDGLLSLYRALQPAAQRFSGVIASGAQAFQQWAQAGLQTGSIDRYMRQAAESASALWGLLKNLGEALWNVLNASAGAGDGLVQTLSDLVGKFAEWSGTVQGQNAIASWAQQGVQAMETLGAVLGTIGSLTSGMFNPAIFQGFLDLIQSMTPMITQVVGVIQSAFMPVLQTIGQAFAENGPKIAALFVALAPLLKGVGAILGQIVKQALDTIGTIAAIITPVVGFISGLLGPALEKLAPIIAAIVLALGPAGLAGAFVRFIPIIGRFLAPIVNFAQTLLKVLGPALGTVGRLVGSTFKAIGSVIGATMRVVGRIVSSTWNAIRGVVVPVSKAVGNAVKTAFNAIRSVVSTVVRFIVNVVKANFNSMRAIATTVFNAIRSVAQSVWNAIKSVIQGAVNTIKGTINGLQSIVATVTGIFSRVVEAVTSKITAAVNVVKGLPGKVTSALGNLGSVLFSAGSNLIQGLIDGIMSKLAAVGNAASAVASKVKGFFGGSPVEEGPLKAWNDGTPGKVLMDMLAMGIYKNMKAVTQAAASVAGGIEQGLATALASGNLDGVLDSIQGKIDKAFDAEKISKKQNKAMTRLVKNTRKGLQGLISEYTKATEALNELRDKHTSLVDSISTSLVGELDLGTAKEADTEAQDAIEAVAAVVDAHGHIVTPAIEGRAAVPATEGAFTFATVSSRIRAMAARIGSFANKLQQLLARGIPKELVQEVAALGSDTGSKVADALLSGSDTEVGALVTDWQALTAGASRAGQVMADAYYATGIAANEAIVKGLLDDERLTAAAEKLADKLTKKIRKALKIKSPSRVLYTQVGKPSGEGAALGLIGGLDSMQNAVNKRAAAMMSPLAVSQTMSSSVPGATQATASTGGSATLRLTDADLKRLAALLRAMAPNMTVQLPTGDPEAAAMSVMNRFAKGGRF